MTVLVDAKTTSLLDQFESSAGHVVLEQTQVIFCVDVEGLKYNSKILLRILSASKNAAAAYFSDAVHLYGMVNRVLQTVPTTDFITILSEPELLETASLALMHDALDKDPYLDVIALRRGGQSRGDRSMLVKNIISLDDFFDANLDDPGNVLFAWKKRMHAICGYFNSSHAAFAYLHLFASCRQHGAIIHALPLSTSLPKALHKYEHDRQNLYKLLQKQVSNGKQCIPKRFILIHEKLYASSMEGGDYRMLLLAEGLASLACYPPLFVSRDSPASDVAAIQAKLQKKGLHFMSTSLDLSELRDALCSSRETKFDAAFLSTWFWRENVPSIAEIVHSYPENLRQCLGDLVIVSDDVHWLRASQGLASYRYLSTLPDNGGAVIPYNVEFITIRERELGVYDDAAAVLTVSDGDAAVMKSLVTSETQFCTLPYVISRSPSPKGLAAPRKGTLCFFGSGHVFNIVAVNWFLHEVWEGLQQSSGKYTFTIVGNYWGDSICGRNEVHCTTALDPSQCWAIIAPVQVALSGLHTKIALALAYGKPVITTRYGTTGFPPEQVEALLVANYPNEFAAILNKLWEDHAFYDNVAEKCLEAAVLDFSLPSCLQRILEQ